MGILLRLKRLFSANMQEGLCLQGHRDFQFKQSLSRMQAEIGYKEEKLKKMIDDRDTKKREHENYSRECDKTEQALAMAADKHKARLIINQLNPQINHRDDLGHRINAMDRQIILMLESVEEQRFRYEQLTEEAREYFYKARTKQPAEPPGGVVQTTPQEGF